MCAACDGDEEDMGPRAPASAEVVAAVKEIESKMPGERVPEHAWAIFFNFAGGAIEWRHYQRIRSSYDAALDAAAARDRAFQPASGPSVMRCDAMMSGQTRLAQAGSKN
jgi:hypothetical protein